MGYICFLSSTIVHSLTPTGKVGKDSAAARFASATPSDFSIQESKPYAEVRSTQAAHNCSPSY